MTETDIPDEAVEAAAQETYGRYGGRTSWSQVPEEIREEYRKEARELLEAAAPAMLAAERERIAQAIEKDGERYNVAFILQQYQKRAASRAARIARGEL